MKKKFKYYNACMSNSSYIRGSEGISIMGKRKLQNLIKLYNEKITKKPVKIYEVTGEWNGFTFPILDKTIQKKDVIRMKKSKKLMKQKNYSELASYYLSQEDTIRNEFINKFDEFFPSAPFMTAENIVAQYISQGRRISKEMINRMFAITTAYCRHRFTDYQNDGNRTVYNDDARRVMAEWQQSSQEN